MFFFLWVDVCWVVWVVLDCLVLLLNWVWDCLVWVVWLWVWCWGCVCVGFWVVWCRDSCIVWYVLMGVLCVVFLVCVVVCLSVWLFLDSWCIDCFCCCDWVGVWVIWVGLYGVGMYVFCWGMCVCYVLDECVVGCVWIVLGWVFFWVVWFGGWVVIVKCVGVWLCGWCVFFLWLWWNIEVGGCWVCKILWDLSVMNYVLDRFIYVI